MTLKDSSGDLSDLPLAKSSKIKIALFIKPYIIKVTLLLVAIVYIISQSTPVYAGFLSNIVNSVVGTDSQPASPIAPPEVIHNSQTVPLLESSINPDLKNIKDDAPIASPMNATLISKNESLGIDYDIEKEVTTEKISTYTVKKGDTIASISKKLKISQTTLIASNADLKKKDLLKVGQNLVILGLKEQLAKASEVAKKELAAKKDDKTKILAKTDSKSVESKTNKKSTPISIPTPPVSKPIDTVQAPLTVSQPEVSVTVPVTLPISTPIIAPSNGQPAGTIDNGYIWPLPAGAGRISQGLHADRAVDISAPKGTPIYAIQNGNVLIAHDSGYNGGYGLYVVIDFDNGAQAIFAHMSKVTADEGQKIKQGDIIGYVGSTGHSTGSHLHIGMHGGSANPFEKLPVNSTGIQEND